jgi:hypothetical protein
MLKRLFYNLKFRWRLRFDFKRLSEEMKIAQESDIFWCNQMDLAIEAMEDAEEMGDDVAIMEAVMNFDRAAERHEESQALI